MKILVTAFGPFGNRLQNASSLALAGLKRGMPWLHTRVLPVDMLLAPLRMNRALRQVRPDVVIMLGEAAGSAAIRLETTAWNELDFRIPDIAGRQPQGVRIAEGAPDSLASTLPLAAIQARLAGAGHAVECSADAGRYLCNQIMFHTLWRIARQSSPATVGFIHLPLETDYPTSRAIEALRLAITG